MLGRVLQAVNGMLCAHEWVTRWTPGRWRVECIHCLATSPGIELGSREHRAASAMARAIST